MPTLLTSEEAALDFVDQLMATRWDVGAFSRLLGIDPHPGQERFWDAMLKRDPGGVRGYWLNIALSAGNRAGKTTGLAILIMTLFVSHLIAGPLYAIKRYLDLISEGNMDFQARLRGKDQTMPLAQSLTRSVEVLNEKISAIQATSLELSDTSRKLQAELKREGGAVSDEISRSVEEMARLGSQISEEAGFFKTRSADRRS